MKKYFVVISIESLIQVSNSGEFETDDEESFRCSFFKIKKKIIECI